MSNAVRHTVRTGLTADILTEAVPGWSDLRAAIDRLRAETTARQTEGPTPVEIHRANTEALINAKDSAAIQAALDEIRETAARRERETADSAAIMSARNSLEDRLNLLERGSVHEVTDVIRARVETISEEIQSMKARPLSPQQAIDTGATTEWTRLGKLAESWTALTHAYSTLVRSEVDGPALTVLSSAAFIRDPLAFHPYFQERRRRAESANTQTRPGTFHEAMQAWAMSAPAPKFDTTEPRGGGGTPRGTDPVQWVVYLAENDVMAVHDPGHALELWKIATAATADLTANNAEYRAQARVEYAKAIGDDDLTTVEDLKPVLANERARGRRRGSVFA